MRTERATKQTKLKTLRRKQQDAESEVPRSAEHAHLLNLQHMVGNRAVQRLLNAPSSTVQARTKKKKPPSKTGYVGMNPLAYKEANALKARLGENVIASLDVEDEHENFDSEEEISAFVEQILGIAQDNSQFEVVCKCLQDADESFREQMAEMMKMFYKAELGEYRLERLVLSGHHIEGTDTMWGDGMDSGNLNIMIDLPNLATAFPKAAAQVEDIMFSSCNTDMEELKEMLKANFPNLRTIWVYKGKSPKIEDGSIEHVREWEKATRGRKKPSSKKKSWGKSAVYTQGKKGWRRIPLRSN